MTKLISEKILTLIGAFILVSILFFPPIKISSTTPALEITDFLIPVLAGIALLKHKDWKNKKLIYLIAAFGAYILISILVNGRYNQIRDYFEIVKLIKFASVIVIFSFISSIDFIKKLIKHAFIILVIFNIIHFMDWFGLNDFLSQYYLGGFRYSVFGLDSIGTPTTKRMLGFVGNPNANAIVFMFFVIYFIPKSESLKKALPWMGVALIMMFLCQSKTALVSTIPVILAYGYFHFKEKTKILAVIGTTVICFFISFFISKYSIFPDEADNPEYVECIECLDNVKNIDWSNLDTTTDTSGVSFSTAEDSLAYIDSCLAIKNSGQETTYLETIVHGEFLGGSSMKGRYEIWRHLWAMIKDKPIFGHAPYKEYFYENELYFENELISMTWRYGFVGLGIYLSILFYLFRLSLKNRHHEMGINLFLLLIVILMTGLTNNPFAHKTVIVLFALTIGLLINTTREEKKESLSESED